MPQYTASGDGSSSRTDDLAESRDDGVISVTDLEVARGMHSHVHCADNSAARGRATSRIDDDQLVACTASLASVAFA